MKKQFLLIVSVILFGASFAAAQNTPAPAKQINKGVLNGAAVNLAKPPYPPAALAVRASGAVNIQVTIDEEGTVVSAAAVSGHPLLRGACVAAAKQSKFSPTLLEGQPVRVTGIIVYNFIAPMSFYQIGYQLALAEKSALTEQFPAANISSNLPNEWKEEKDQTSQLGTYAFLQNNKKQTVSSQQSAPDTSKALTHSADLSAGNYRGVLTVGSLAPAGAPFDAENFKPSEAIKKLHTNIENRLSGDPEKLWSFKFGSTLGSIAAEIESGEKTQANIAELNRIIADAPPNASKSVIDKAKEIVDFAQQGVFDGEKKAALIDKVKMFRGL